MIEKEKAPECRGLFLCHVLNHTFFRSDARRFRRIGEMPFRYGL